MKHYLVDFENVRSGGLYGVERLTREDHVTVLYTRNANTISIGEHLTLMHCEAQVEFLELMHLGKHALDFQLVMMLGVLGGRYEKEEPEFYIISSDTGYDVVLEMNTLIGLNARIRRCRTIAEAVDAQRPREEVLEEAAVAVTNSQEVAVRDILLGTAFEARLNAILKTIRECTTKDEVHCALGAAFKNDGTAIYKIIKPALSPLKKKKSERREGAHAPEQEARPHTEHRRNSGEGRHRGERNHRDEESITAVTATEAEEKAGLRGETLEKPAALVSEKEELTTEVTASSKQAEEKTPAPAEEGVARENAEEKQPETDAPTEQEKNAGSVADMKKKAEAAEKKEEATGTVAAAAEREEKEKSQREATAKTIEKAEASVEKESEKPAVFTVRESAPAVEVAPIILPETPRRPRSRAQEKKTATEPVMTVKMVETAVVVQAPVQEPERVTASAERIATEPEEKKTKKPARGRGGRRKKETEQTAVVAPALETETVAVTAAPEEAGTRGETLEKPAALISEKEEPVLETAAVSEQEPAPAKKRSRRPRKQAQPEQSAAAPEQSAPEKSVAAEEEKKAEKPRSRRPRKPRAHKEETDAE